MVNENIFQITLKEMSKLYSNFLSINKKTVISDKRFNRLNRLAFRILV